MAANGSEAQEPNTVYEFFHEHPAILGSLVYLQVTLIGIIYSMSLYSEFGINVFDFAEANDFLLASMKEPVAFLMSFVTIIFFAFYIYLMPRLSYFRNMLRSPRARRTTIGVFVFIGIIYTLLPSVFFAGQSAESIRAGKTGNVTVLYKPEAQHKAAVERKVTLIGSTEKFAFFYDQPTSETVAVPLANIQMITFPKTGARRGFLWLMRQ